jgi:hypothetical protein
MRLRSVGMMVALAAGMGTVPAIAMMAQDAAAAATPHAVGTVKATNAGTLTLTSATGDVTVTVPGGAKVLVVAPGSKDLKSATVGTVSDVGVGDKVLVTGTAGDSATALTATRVVLMKAQAIADTHAAEDAAWARGGGGIVKSVDATSGTLVIASGLKTVTVTTTTATVVKRYAGSSVAFADAVASTVGAIQPGDQVRVRGTKSADGSSIAADGLVSGRFGNYSGLISGVDGTAGTVTLKDLTTKKPVTVVVAPTSDVRRIPPALAARVAAGMKGGVSGTGPAGAGAPAGAGGAPAGADAAGGARRAGMDLSQMLSRLPTETLAGLKVGDAVMIVATLPGGDSDNKATAVTLLAGVDAILTASPSGQAATLSPWSLGGGEGGGAGAEGGPQRAASPQ